MVLSILRKLFFKRACAAIWWDFICVNSEGSGEPVHPGETARMRRLTWAVAGRLCDKYHYFVSWLIYRFYSNTEEMF